MSKPYYIPKFSIRSIDVRVSKTMHSLGKQFKTEYRKMVGVQGPPRSLPNMPPHIDKGKLINAYHYRVDKTKKETGLYAQVRIANSKYQYASYLEKGTKKMAKRPFIAPLMIKWQHMFNRRFRGTLNRIRIKDVLENQP